jgi:hypothetical protein
MADELIGTGQDVPVKGEEQFAIPEANKGEAVELADGISGGPEPELNRRNFCDRLKLEVKMNRDGGYCTLYILFFTLYLTTVGTFQRIDYIAEVHQTLASRFTKGLDDVSTVDGVMIYMQHFIETSYEMASALVDANTMNDLDPNRCFDVEVGDVCRLSFWMVPLIDRTKASWVNMSRIRMDRIGQHQESSSFWNNCEMRLCDWATTPCGGNQTRVFPEFKSINYKVQEGGCLYLPFHLDPGLPNGTTFGLTPEDPMILDSLRDFPYKSVVPLSPVVYQQRAQVVPCSGFGNLYNDDVLGAGFCSPEEPCDPAKVTSFTASRNNPYTERQQTIYVGYVEAAFPCGDNRLEDTSDFMDKSWFPAAGFRHLTEGKPADRGTIDGKNVFYKFASDTAYLSQPLNGSQLLCGIGLKTVDPDDLGVPGPGIYDLQRCLDCGAGDLETPGGRACHVYAKKRVSTVKVLAMNPTEIVQKLINLGSTLVPTTLGGTGNVNATMVNGSGLTLADFEPIILQANLDIDPYFANFTLIQESQEEFVTLPEKKQQYNWMGRTIADPMQNRAHEMWCDGESGVVGCHFKSLCLGGGAGYPPEQCDLRAKQAENEDAQGYAGATAGRRLWSKAYLATTLRDRRNTFVSLATRELAIMALVITPQGNDYEDIATLARVTFAFSQHGSIKGTWQAVSVSQLGASWAATCYVTIVFCLLYLFGVIYQMRPRIKEFGIRGVLVSDLVDIVISLAAPAHLVVTFTLPEFPSREMTAAFAANDQAVYFAKMALISANATQVEVARQAGSIIAYILFLRFVGYMSLHPRIAILVDTMKNIADDVIHFLITSLALFCTLAFQGFWSFGMSDPSFESYTMSLWTQFQMVVGAYPWPDGGVENGIQGFMQIVYLFIFTFLVFFVLLNFFLAIVVDAFSSIKTEVAINRSDQAFFRDVLSIFTSFAYRLYYKYPDPGLTYHVLNLDLEEKLRIGKAGMSARDIDFETFIKCEPIQPNAITHVELYENVINYKGERCFTDKNHARQYLKWYYKKVADSEGFGLAEDNPWRLHSAEKPYVNSGIPKITQDMLALNAKVEENCAAPALQGAPGAMPSIFSLPPNAGPMQCPPIPHVWPVAPTSLQAQITNYTLEVARIIEGIHMLARTSQEWGPSMQPTAPMVNSEIQRVEAHVRSETGGPQFAPNGHGPESTQETRQDALMAVANALTEMSANGQGASAAPPPPLSR